MIFVAVVMQTISGFGFALVIMPLLTMALGYQTAAPLVALVGLTLYVINFIRYRRAVNFGEVFRLGIASALGVPVGIWALNRAYESTIRLLLGVVLIVYATYALVRPNVPALSAGSWVYLVGFAAGCLGGAYNVPGPPVVVYGIARRWPRDKFRAILQAFFFVNGMLVVISHLLASHLTIDVFTFYVSALPALTLGTWVGTRVDVRLNHDRFRTVITVMLLGMGASLMIGSS
jgi:uncharacterized membrane protein YfcA